MKKIIIIFLSMTLLCSCAVHPIESTSTKPSVSESIESNFSAPGSSDSSQVSDEPVYLPTYEAKETEVVGKFGGEYSFDFHYAQTPEYFFYPYNCMRSDENGGNTNEYEGIIRLEKKDFSKKIIIADAASFNIGKASELSVSIIGITSKWLFVSVWNKNNNESKNNIYKVSLNGDTVELLVKSVESAYFHPGNGLIYFTVKDESNTVNLNFFDLKSNEKNVLPIGDHEITNSNWFQLINEKIALISYPVDFIINENNKIEFRRIEINEEAPEYPIKNEAYAKLIETNMNKNRTLSSFAKCKDYIYYVDFDGDYENISLNRMDLNGKNNVILKKDTNVDFLFSYDDQLYGEMMLFGENDLGDIDKLIMLDENGSITETGAFIRGISGRVKIEGGLFISAYRNLSGPFLCFVYNPKTQQAEMTV